MEALPRNGGVGTTMWDSSENGVLRIPMEVFILYFSQVLRVNYILLCQSKKTSHTLYTSLWFAETFTDWTSVKYQALISGHIDAIPSETHSNIPLTWIMILLAFYGGGAVAQPLTNLLYLLQSACLYTSNKSRSPPVSPARPGEHDITRDYPCMIPLVV